MKVSFRKVREKDLKRLNEIVNDEEVIRYLSLKTPVSMKSTIDIYRKYRKAGEFWYSIIVDGELAGSFTLAPGGKTTKKSHVGVFGIALAKDYWGRDIGDKSIKFMLSEARKLKLKRIELIVARGNKRARKLYESNGFKKEGVMKMAVKINGKYHDDIMMARFL